jgi:uncharacterized protein DUF1707
LEEISMSTQPSAGQFGSVPSGEARIRASDAEREEYAKAVREAVVEGRLSLDEGDERLAKIYAATYRDELRPFVADLPREAVAPIGWSRPDAPHGPDAVRRMRYGLARHALFVGSVAVVLISIWALTGAHLFWPLFPLAFLAFGLLRHGLWWRWGGWRGGYRGWYHHQHHHHESTRLPQA